MWTLSGVAGLLNWERVSLHWPCLMRVHAQGRCSWAHGAIRQIDPSEARGARRMRVAQESKAGLTGVYLACYLNRVPGERTAPTYAPLRLASLLRVLTACALVPSTATYRGAVWCIYYPRTHRPRLETSSALKRQPLRPEPPITLAVAELLEDEIRPTTTRGQAQS